jgi:hypothetical protein
MTLLPIQRTANTRESVLRRLGIASPADKRAAVGEATRILQSARGNAKRA